MRTLFAIFILLSLHNDALSVTDSLFVRLKGDSTFIWDSYADENCGSKFVTTVRVSNDTVYAVRIDTSRRQTTCDCVFQFRFTVVGLSAGHYLAVIYRQPFNGSLSLVDTISFNVSTQPSTGMSYALSQSACGAAIDGIEAEPPPLPLWITLLQNYPNPFNPATTIRYGIPARSHVSLIVFNTLGQEVSLLQNGEQEAGYHEVRFDGTNLASGVYFYRIVAGDFVQTKRLLLLR